MTFDSDVLLSSRLLISAFIITRMINPIHLVLHRVFTAFHLFTMPTSSSSFDSESVAAYSQSARKPCLHVGDSRAPHSNCLDIFC